MLQNDKTDASDAFFYVRCATDHRDHQGLGKNHV